MSSTNAINYKFIICNVLVAMLCFYLYNLPNTPLLVQSAKKQNLVLGNSIYEMKAVKAPALTYPFLYPAAYLISKSFLGDILARLIINDNQVYKIRLLSYQINLPPLYYPIRKVENHNVPKPSDPMENTLSMISSLNVNLQSRKFHKHHRTILDYAKAYRYDNVLPSTVMTTILKQIRTWEKDPKDPYRIMASVNISDVMRQAYESDQRFRLNQSISIFDGIPIAVKDMIRVVGHKYFNGLNPSDHVIGDGLSDDTMIKRFKNLGAIIIGTTIMVESGVSTLGYNTHFKGPYNSYNKQYYTGGSSSGSAAVLSSGLVPVAIGFDSGGSIRVPAAMSGVFGLATTFGRIPFDTYNANSLLKGGPMTHSALDTALAYSVMSPIENNHFYTLLHGKNNFPPIPDVSGFENIADLSDVRIGIYPEWFSDVEDENIRKKSEAVLAFLCSRGAQIVNITIPHLQELSFAHAIKVTSEFASDLDKYYNNQNYSSLESNTQILVKIGMSFTAVEALAADTLRAWIFEFMIQLFEQNHLTTIITPTLCMTAPKIPFYHSIHGESNSELVMKLMKYVSLVNFVGMPGYSVPIGFVKNRESVELPIGLQLIGNHWTENKLLRLANAIEQGYINQEYVRNPFPVPQYFIDPIKIAML